MECRHDPWACLAEACTTHDPVLLKHALAELIPRQREESGGRDSNPEPTPLSPDSRGPAATETA